MLIIGKILSTSVLILFLYPGELEAGGENVQARLCTTKSNNAQAYQKDSSLPMRGL